MIVLKRNRQPLAHRNRRCNAASSDIMRIGVKRIEFKSSSRSALNDIASAPLQSPSFIRGHRLTDRLNRIQQIGGSIPRGSMKKPRFSRVFVCESNSRCIRGTKLPAIARRKSEVLAARISEAYHLPARRSAGDESNNLEPLVLLGLSDM